MKPAEVPYSRVDKAKLEETSAKARRAVRDASGDAFTVRLLVIPASITLCVLQAILSVYNTNVLGTITSSTLIAVVAFTLLFGVLLCVNPMLRLTQEGAVGIGALVGAITVVYTALAWSGFMSEGFAQLAAVFQALTILLWIAVSMNLGGIRPFNRPELICIFAAMMVTSGISTFGLTEQLVPLVATPFNPDWNKPQRGWNDRLIPNLNPSLYIRDPEVIKTFRQGVTQDTHGKALLRPPENAYPWEKATYYWQVFINIPWSAWAWPLGAWMIFIAGAYGMFYSLTYVVLGYWSDREKLIFPLAKLPESMMPDPQAPGEWIPGIFRTPGFWVGFTLSFSVVAWNCLISANLISGVSPISLGSSGYATSVLFSGSPLEGLAGGISLLVIFTAVGIAFFLPLEISFSIWFYFIAGQAAMLIAIWSGLGRSTADFPTNWMWNNNFISGQGSGGLLVFSFICLFRCVRDYIRLIPGKPLKQKALILTPVLGLVASAAIVTGWLSWSNRQMGTPWAFVFVFVVMLVTIGIMRIVAEGGVYWFQSHTSFFHIYKMLGLGRWLPPVVLGPLLPIYSVLFLDVKTFLAPNLLNAAKMEHSMSAGQATGSRTRFHASVLLSIIVSVFVSLGFAIFLAHVRGAEKMHGWFYAAGPMQMMDIAASATVTPPAVDYPTISWYAVGAIWVGLSFFFRTTVFWFPHPIGYIMLVNPLMSQLWLSFFIGWICKKLTVKYGGKATYERLRVVFIGLIMGELIAISFWGMLSMLTSIHATGFDLNRY